MTTRTACVVLLLLLIGAPAPSRVNGQYALGRMRASMPLLPSLQDGEGSEGSMDSLLDRPIGIASDIPYRDFEPANNATKSCNTHWRLGHVIHACTSSLQPDQLAMRIKYSEINGVKILDHLHRAFNATKPKAEDELATYEILQGENSCLNRTLGPEGHSCTCSCETIVRLHFAIEAPIKTNPEEVTGYFRSTVLSFINSIPGVCASDGVDIDSSKGLHELATSWDQPVIASSSLPQIVAAGHSLASPKTFCHTNEVSAVSNVPDRDEAICMQSDWRKSFEKRGWSMCTSSSTGFINALYRSKWGKDTTSETIGMLDRAQCCESAPAYQGTPISYRTADWSSSFKRKGWSLCPSGYLLHGLFRASSDASADLRDIELARCAKPASHPLQHGHCYDEDVSQVFNSMGWSSCTEAGYYIAGLYRNSNHDLRDIDRLRCCSMLDDIGSQPDLIQALPSQAITMSSCHADFSSTGMHGVLGKHCDSRGYFSHCLKFHTPQDCVAKGLTLGAPSTKQDGHHPYVVIDLGKIRHVGHGVIFGRGDDVFAQDSMRKVQVFGMQTLEGGWDTIGNSDGFQTDFLDLPLSSKDHGAPFVVNKEIRYLKLASGECRGKQCAMRLQLFENSYISNPLGSVVNALVASDIEITGNKISKPSSIELWACPNS